MHKPRLHAVVIGIGLVAATAVTALAVPASAKPLPVLVALNATGLADRIPISLSPDGRIIAYTLARTAVKEPMSGKSQDFSVSGVMEEAFGTDIWLADTTTRKSRNLTGGKGANYDPTWSPDGKYLAFLSDRGGTDGLWVWNRATNRLRRVSPQIVHAFFTFEVPRWTPDSKRIIVKLLPAGMSIATAAALDEPSVTGAHAADAPLVYIFDPNQQSAAAASSSSHAPIVSPFQRREVGDISAITLATGAVTRLATGVEPVGWWVSPDGTKLAYTTLRGVAGETSQQILMDLRVIDLATRTTTTVAPLQSLGYGVTVSWSPDSKHLAFITAGPDQTSATKVTSLTRGDVYLASLDGAAPVNLTPGNHPSFYSDLRPPRWSANGKALFVTTSNGVDTISFPSRKLSTITTFPNAQVLGIVGNPLTGDSLSASQASVDVVTRNKATFQEGITRVALSTGMRTQLFADNLRFASTDMGIAGTRNGVIAYVTEDAKHGQQMYASTDNFRTRAVVAQFSPELAQYSLGSSRLISFRNTMGVALHGALLLPGNYQPGHRYPLVVRVYGGEYSSDGVNRFGLEGYGPDNMQILASRGYAVLEPDTPLRPGHPLKDLAADVMPAIDKVIAMGIADPNRLGVEGHSYGGYSTLALIVQSPRFKAAIDSAGPADLFTEYTAFENGETFGIGWAEEGQGRMRGTPWQYRQRYIDNSPFFFLNKVQTPLLIVHGSADTTVPLSETDMIFVGLRRLGKPVEYVVYPGEDHWQGTWKLPHVLDYWNRSINFLDAHLHP